MIRGLAEWLWQHATAVRTIDGLTGQHGTLYTGRALFRKGTQAVIWRTAHRRWKRAVEAAMSPVWHLNERDRLAAVVARRIWLAHGGATWADAQHEGTLLSLEEMVSKHLSDEIVRASLGLRYFEVLAADICRAEYEDVGALLDEAHWVERYLQRKVRCPLVGDLGRGTMEDMPEQATLRRERLFDALVRASVAELRNAGVTA